MLLLLPFAAVHGAAALDEVLRVALLEYLSSIILLLALFVISGGIRVRGNLVGTPRSTRRCSRWALGLRT